MHAFVFLYVFLTKIFPVKDQYRNSYPFISSHSFPFVDIKLCPASAFAFDHILLFAVNSVSFKLHSSEYFAPSALIYFTIIANFSPVTSIGVPNFMAWYPGSNALLPVYTATASP